MSYSADDLLIRPMVSAAAPSEVLSLDQTSPGFELLSFSVRNMKKGGTFKGRTDQNELCIAMLGGTCSVRSSAGTWEHVGKRANVFAGMPHALYLPIRTEYSVTADTDCEMALCSARAEESYPAHLVTP